jgi:flagellar hook-associated protein 3 FlgL
MSGTVNAYPAVSYGLLGELSANAALTKTQLDTLTEQSASGLVSSDYGGLGTGAKVALDLTAEASQQQGYISAITSADNVISVTQTTMNQLSSIASSFSAQLDNLTNGGVDTLAASAQQALQQVADLLNTQVGTVYIFGGQYSDSPPIPDAQNILSSGFYSQINTAVSQLATANAATDIPGQSEQAATATEQATLAVAQSNVAGTSPFSASLSQPAATLVPAALPVVQVGPGQTVTVGLIAGANATAVSTSTTTTTGSYVRDLMRSLATLGSLTNSQQNDPHFQDLINDTQGTLKSATTALADEEANLGTTQNQIDATGSLYSHTASALNSQISSVENVDLTTTSSQLSSVQTQLQISYKLISEVNSLSLVTYL